MRLGPAPLEALFKETAAPMASKRTQGAWFKGRLLTTILDPTVGPAATLVGLYAERWEIETALDELKTHQRSPRVVLRSKMPEGVTQEAYAYFCVHYAIHWLMHSVALAADTDPDRHSLNRTLRVAGPTTASHPDSSPSGADDAHRQATSELLFELLGPPRQRSRRQTKDVELRCDVPRAPKSWTTARPDAESPIRLRKR